VAITIQLAIALAAASSPQLRFVQESRPFAGGMATISVVGAPSTVATALDEAFARFARVDEVMNEWSPGSAVSRLNAAAGSGSWTPLPADLCHLVRVALAGARRTGGLFDPTWAALRPVWRFGEGAEAPPSADAVSELCPLVSWRAVEVEPALSGACRARLPRTGMAIGLGGIAKGWAVDEAARALRRRGLADFLVQAGGDLYAAGRRGRDPWRVAVRDPRGPRDAAFAEMEVQDRAFSTSGDYEHAYLVDGARYHHVIDPRTCYPATASRSVTVLARSAVQAEILSKALFIAGGDAALRMAERDGAAAVVVTADNRVLRSPSLRKRLRVFRAPTP
jgi:FAD:protein FMN transferase